MLKVGTLRDLFHGSSDRVLSCLELPTSSLDVVETPGLRYVPNHYLFADHTYSCCSGNLHLTVGHGCKPGEARDSATSPIPLM